MFNLVLDDPCTAVDFELDGRTLAVGTTRGKVVVYDMRNTTACVKNFQVGLFRVNYHDNNLHMCPIEGGKNILYCCVCQQITGTIRYILISRTSWYVTVHTYFFF